MDRYEKQCWAAFLFVPWVLAGIFLAIVLTFIGTELAGGAIWGGMAGFAVWGLVVVVPALVFIRWVTAPEGE